MNIEDKPINHEEALELAYIKQQESNLARCYISLTAKVQELEKDKGSLMDENVELQNSIDELNAGYEFLKDKKVEFDSRKYCEFWQSDDLTRKERGNDR